MLYYTLLLISVVLLLVAFAGNKGLAKNHILIASAVSIILGAYSMVFFVADYFTGKGIDNSVIYHLNYGFVGAGYQEYWFLIALSGAVLLAYAVLPFLLTRNAAVSSMNTLQGPVLLLFVLLAFIINPTTYSLAGYLQAETAPTYSEASANFSDFYRLPAISQTSEKQNIIYIYAEGLERTYFDESVFPGLITELRDLESMGTSFTNIKQVYGTGWTIAGLTATQCGIPLVTASHGNSMSGVDRFLPNATCLGDLLASQGYNLSYLSGSSIEFAGIERLFSTHAFNKISGREELRGHLPDPRYQNGWGLYDDTLLGIAAKEIDALSSQDRPFGLFLSTMDTHHPKGHPSRSCKGKKYGHGYNPILNAVVCTDFLLGKFVKDILASGHAKNTVIVITSDHLALRNTATDKLDSLERRNLFIVIEPGGRRYTVNKEGSMLDVASTLLPYLGFKGEMGLGRDLRDHEPSIASTLVIDEALKSWTKPLERFWGFPELDAEDEFQINVVNRTVSVNQRVFKYPLLIEFEEDYSTTIKFQFAQPAERDRLVSHVARLESGKPFLWIDACRTIRTEFIKISGRHCVVYGRAATRKLVYSEIREAGDITVSDIYDVAENTALTAKARLRSETRISADNQDVNRFIAHAGGEIEDNKYTDALEALDLSYQKGFRLFELDIIKTSDGIYVAAHDWAHWQAATGYQGDTPPTHADFKQHRIKNKYTPLDINDINQWFERHPDAVLVTDKVNAPLEFSEIFTDKSRLIMELFTMSAVREGLRAGIKSAMPTWDVLTGMGGDKVRVLLDMGVTDVAVSRRLIKNNRGLIRDLKNNGIRVYVFHVNFDAGIDEAYVVCNDMEYIYGLYADKHDFRSDLDCSQHESLSYWYTGTPR